MLGQVGKVLKVYADGDLRVAFGGQTWTFNPACLSAQPVEVDANLMTAENPNESGSKASAGKRGLISNTPAPALSPAGFQLSPYSPSFQLCYTSFLIHAASVASSLFVFFQQCVKYASFWNFLCSISWSCTLTAGGHVCHHVTSSQQSLNHDKIFSVYVFSSDYGRLTTDWCVFANVCGQIPVHAGTFWLILAFVNQFEWLIFFFFFLQGLCDIRIEVEKTNVILLSSVPFSHPTPTPPLLPLFLTLSLFRYCHLSAGEAALSVHRARQSQSASHWGSAWQCQQGAGAGAEVSWQG